MAFDPPLIAAVAARLRDRTVATLDELPNEALDEQALPGWTVADVFRHLAETDRTTVLGRHLLDFLPSQDPDDFERGNDAALARLRDASRYQLRHELVVWGARLQRIIRLTPAPVARLHVPTMFGRVSLGWFATTRIYDEWVHQDDVARALGRPEPAMERDVRDLLAEFQLRALPAGPLARLEHRDGVVEVRLDDLPDRPPWRFDLAARRFGAHVDRAPTVVVATDVPTWNRIAADRVTWREAERGGVLTVDGSDRAAAEALLDAVRVV